MAAELVVAVVGSAVAIAAEVAVAETADLGLDLVSAAHPDFRLRLYRF